MKIFFLIFSAGKMCHNSFLSTFKGPFESVGFLLWELYVLTVHAILPSVNFIAGIKGNTLLFPFFIRMSIFRIERPGCSHFLGSFSLTMFIRILNFNNENLITLKLDIAMIRQWLQFYMNELYKYIVNVSLTIHDRNVLKEQNFTCILIPCKTLRKPDFQELGE